MMLHVKKNPQMRAPPTQNEAQKLVRYLVMAGPTVFSSQLQDWKIRICSLCNMVFWKSHHPNSLVGATAWLTFRNTLPVMRKLMNRQRTATTFMKVGEVIVVANFVLCRPSEARRVYN